MWIASLFTLATITLTLIPGSTCLATSGGNLGECPSECRCQGHDNLKIDCSGIKLRRPPPTSVSTLSLDISRNSLGPIINASFARMGNLTDLDLSYNGITRLLGCTFNGMLSLRRVSLRGNRLTTLPDSLFTDSNGVEQLDLSHNIFVALPDHVFRNTPNLKTLDLSHNRAVELKLGLRFQVPRHLAYLDLSHNLFEYLDTDSFHMASQWEVGIKRTLKLANCRLTAIQEGALTKIPDLNELDLSGNPEIPTENITGVIKELERRRLEKLSLSGMNLTNIDTFFTQVTLLALKFLNVSHNQISSLPSGMFSTIRSLRVLDLSHNKLTSLGAGIKDLVNLRVLNMSTNALVSFKGQAVNNLDKVEVLDLSDNRLASVSNFKLRPLIKLQKLNVRTNLLSSVILPQTTNNLVEIDYSSNSIRRFRGFDNVPKLERFDISDNDLEKVEEFLFKQSHIMKVANFSRNSITEIDPRAFLPQSPLVIDMSRNFVSKIQYSNWVATQELYLNHNQIEEVDMQTFHRMTGLHILDLSENNITALHEDLLGHTTALERLSLSHNSLTQVHFSVLFRQLQDLRSLDLGSNNISHLNESMLKPLHKLQVLSVRNNRLEVIMPRVFRDLKHIREIDLSNNPFVCVCDMLALRDWLIRTHISIPGLYNVNSSSYTCRGPSSRLDVHVMKWEPGQFECDEVMLYMIVFGSIGCTLIVAGIISSVAHRLYLRHQRGKDEEMKKKKIAGQLGVAIDIDDLKRPGGKKVELKNMSSIDIADDFRDAIEKRERRSMRRAEESKRANGYVAWPAGKKNGEKGKEKEERRGVKTTTNETPGRKENGRTRSPERYYDHLTRTDGGRMELVGRDNRERGSRDVHGNEGRREGRDDRREDRRDGREERREDRRDGRDERREGKDERRDGREERRDRGVEYIDLDGGGSRQRNSKPVLSNPSRRHQESRGQYSDMDRMYRAEPLRRGDPYTTAACPPGLPPRNRWDDVEVWDRDARGWVIPGHRRSRSQGQRRERDEQRYMTMPVREQDYYRRSRSNDRAGRGRPAMYLDRYRNEVRFGIEDLNRYPTEQRRSRRDLYENRSKSYHTLPSVEYRSAAEVDRGSLRRSRPHRDTGHDERQYWTDEGRPPIGPRAASQPFLANENASDWL